MKNAYAEQTEKNVSSRSIPPAAEAWLTWNSVQKISAPQSPAPLHDMRRAKRASAPATPTPKSQHSTLAAIQGRMSAYTGQRITWEQALHSQEDLTPGHWEFGAGVEAELATPGRTKFS